MTAMGSEAAIRQMACILGEHGEEAPHQEFGDVPGVVLAFEALSDGGKATSNVAGDFGGFLGGIEAVRVGPGRLEAGLDGGIAQLVHIDAEALRIGELGIVFALAGKVGMELDDVADIDKDDEAGPQALSPWRAP
jgi:hypothetical protein